MTDKAYIVANNKQELDILRKFEQKGLLWRVGRNATSFIPSENGVFNKFASFPYAIIEKEFIIWSPIEQLEDETIVYDGRKDEKMYKVTQEFMNELIEWRDEMNLDTNVGTDTFVDGHDIQNLHDVVNNWWSDNEDPIECNNRLIAIIKWLNDEDVFEVEEPHNFVVRNDTPDNRGDYWFVHVYKGMSTIDFYIRQATKFDTREEAQEWANSHQVVVEIDAEGNEVE